MRSNPANTFLLPVISPMMLAYRERQMLIRAGSESAGPTGFLVWSWQNRRRQLVPLFR
jgi:hypothetical protein